MVAGVIALLMFNGGGCSNSSASTRVLEIRKIDGRKDRMEHSRIEHFRAKLPEEYRSRKNFAWAMVDIPGQTKTEYFAHSGIHNLEQF